MGYTGSIIDLVSLMLHATAEEYAEIGKQDKDIYERDKIDLEIRNKIKQDKIDLEIRNKIKQDKVKRNKLFKEQLKQYNYILKTFKELLESTINGLSITDIIDNNLSCGVLILKGLYTVNDLVINCIVKYRTYSQDYSMKYNNEIKFQKLASRYDIAPKIYYNNIYTFNNVLQNKYKNIVYKQYSIIIMDNLDKVDNWIEFRNLKHQKYGIDIYDRLICKKIKYLHSIKIVHGDLNFGNIFVNTKSKEVKLIDFECAMKIRKNINPWDFECHELWKNKCRVNDYVTIPISRCNIALIDKLMENPNRFIATSSKKVLEDIVLYARKYYSTYNNYPFYDFIYDKLIFNLQRRFPNSYIVYIQR